MSSLYLQKNRTEQYEDVVVSLRDLAGREGVDIAQRAVTEALQDPLRDIFLTLNKEFKKTSGSVAIRFDDAPFRDHVEKFTRDDKTPVMASHTYSPIDTEGMRKILDFCDRRGMEATIDPGSWYFCSRTLLVYYEVRKAREGNGD